MNEKTEKIDFFGLLSLVIGSVIGIGIFFKFKGVLATTENNTTVAIVSWIIGAVISISAALTIAEIASAAKKSSGGIGSLGTVTFGRNFGFIAGWIQIVYIVMIITAIGYFTSIFADAAMQTNLNAQQLIILTFVFVIIAFGTNLISTKAGSNVQKVTTVIKVVPLVAMIIIGLLGDPKAETPINLFSSNSYQGTKPVVELIAAALIPILFAFDGWIFSTAAAGEVKKPEKNVPKAIIIGIGFVGLVYVLINYSLMSAAPLDIIIKGGVGGAATYLTNNPLAGKLVNICIAVSAYGILNGYGLLSQRFIYGLASEDNFFAKNFFTKKNNKDFPINSGVTMFLLVIISVIICAILMVQAGGTPDNVAIIADQVSNIPTVLIWTVYFVIFIGWFKIRSKKIETAFKLKGIALISPFLVIVSVAYILYVSYNSEIILFNSSNTFPIGIATALISVLTGFIALAGYKVETKNKLKNVEEENQE
jgi:APA family basic amino acid/polyamine antiporter